MPRAATSQSSRYPPRAAPLPPLSPPRARRIPNSPAPKPHRLPLPRAKTPPASPLPQPPLPACPSTPPRCVPPSSAPRPESSSAAPDRSRGSPAPALRRSSPTKSSAPALGPPPTPTAASQRNVFRARKENRTAPARLRAHACESRESLRYEARRARRTLRAAPARDIRRHPHPRALGSVFFRRAVRGAGQSSLASIAAFSSPVNARPQFMRLKFRTRRAPTEEFLFPQRRVRS